VTLSADVAPAAIVFGALGGASTNYTVGGTNKITLSSGINAIASATINTPVALSATKKATKKGRRKKGRL
jgi:hypothetical protein